MNPLTHLADLPVDLAEVLTWQQAVVAIVIILAVIVVPQIVQMVQNNNLAKQMKNNGGSTMRDAIDRIERKVDAQGEQLNVVEQRLDQHLTDDETGSIPLH